MDILTAAMTFQDPPSHLPLNVHLNGARVLASAWCSSERALAITIPAGLSLPHLTLLPTPRMSSVSCHSFVWTGLACPSGYQDRGQQLLGKPGGAHRKCLALPGMQNLASQSKTQLGGQQPTVGRSDLPGFHAWRPQGRKGWDWPRGCSALRTPLWPLA